MTEGWLSWPLVALGLLFLVLLVAELAWPFAKTDWRRWPANLGLGFVSVLLARLLSFVGPLAAAVWADQSDFGLFHLLGLPFWAALVLGVIAMDFAIWVQHLQMHRSKLLWKVHRLHHADPRIDLSTGVRFHPLEAIVSLGWKSLCAALLGLPPQAVPIFELWLSAGSLIEHANLRLPDPADHAVRKVWVTPGMHRIHHSAHADDARHNLGFALAVWDRIFGTYRAEPSGPRIGLPDG